MRILVTGGAGFIGSNFVHHMRRHHPECSLLVLDALTYAGNLANLQSLAHDPGFEFVHGDILDEVVVEACMRRVDAVVHFAAESHVDRSLSGPQAFVKTNVEGSLVLLEAARRHAIRRFVQVSTDEVYGSLGPTGLFSEASPLAANSPYSASKASADLMARAYHESFGLPVLITRCSNNYGPYQFPEKLIPLFITNALHDEGLPVYGDGLNVRDWLHVEDHCDAVKRVLFEGRAGDVYNIGGHNERTNIEITEAILAALDKPRTLMRYVADRPGHDRRYAIDAQKIRTELGWQPQYTFETGLAATITWYQHNRDWWLPLRTQAVEVQRAAANRA